ncbi:DEAD/DEAH box helicase [Rhizobium sp. C1]|uniref:DEAD/DEAH box helicase n=1 Tax=Rhizobium sp. C1 TaxID=1349799 RepID=UPI001E3E33EF|nr:DEAD/DEAH box helicase [Rhizobium sp. C1]MCD2178740.1 DEAD/DEAH box helicase [Rhizobium sp. C1]
MTILDGVATPLGNALQKRGYTQLTPVQEAMLADDLKGRDALVSAKTGSGKTVAFGLAIAPDILGENRLFGPAEAPLALAIAPTRELAMQVARELEWLYGEAHAVIATCVGGMDTRKERRALERGCHIVVGTPGRLRDHITRNALDLSNLAAVVLDEADEMLDLGFREDLEFILGAAPTERRTLMFSATVPKSIATLAKSYQRDAMRITTAAEEQQHSDIEYRALLCAAPDRENAILNTLRYYDAATAIVFCSTRAAVAHLTARFSNRGFPAVSLSGELTQNERSHALQAMRDGRARVCIATDVAARGIDLPSLELVVHADLPTNAETLKHRSGRTGRAGRKGVSALIVPLPARRKAERLLDAAGINAEWANPPTAAAILQRDDERLLTDPELSLGVDEDDREMAARLIEAHGAEKIAAAYIRHFRSTRFAPEDIQEMAVYAPKSREARDATRERRTNDFEPQPARAREDFDESVWFSLSVGRKQNAEPRWLIPMLCRAGNIGKRDIGTIKMMPGETYVEIHASAADGFTASLGPKMLIEDKLRVKKLDARPDMSRSGPREAGHRDERPQGDFKKPDWKKKGDYAGKSDGGKPYKGKSFDGKPGGAKGGKPDWKKKKG